MSGNKSLVKPRVLGDTESFASYQTWRRGMEYCIKKDPTFCKVISKPWKMLSVCPHRGFVDATNDKKEALAEAVTDMLEFINQFVPHYLNDSIMLVTSISEVWTIIRKYLGLRQSEAGMLKYASLRKEPGERPERLYQRIVAHIQDNLLKADGDVLYGGSKVESDEVMTPTLERLAVVKWLELLHPELPTHVLRVFSSQLQNQSLRDLQPQICDALDSLLEEVETRAVSVQQCAVDEYSYHGEPYRPDDHQMPDVQCARAFQPTRGRGSRPFRRPARGGYGAQFSRSCRLCEAEGRRSVGHTLATCHYLTQGDKMGLSRVSRVDVDEDLGYGVESCYIGSHTDA